MFQYNPNSGWQRILVESGISATYSSIAVDSNENIYISYFDDGSDDLKFAYYDGVDWSLIIVDGLDTNVGSHTSICLDANEIPHITYYDLDLNELKHATITEATMRRLRNRKSDIENSKR